MKFTLEISCDNAAFGETPDEITEEVRRILEWTAPRLYRAQGSLELRDSNGNKVGAAKFEGGR